MNHIDRYGLLLTTGSPRAAKLYGEGLDEALAGNGPADRLWDEAAAADPDFALAHIGRATLLQMRGRAADARAALTQARVTAKHATRREQQHVALLAAMLEGDNAAALAQLYAHLAEFPRDAYVLAQATGAYGLLSFSGQPDHPARRLGLCATLAPHYGDDWWFLGMHAFSLVETDAHAPAREKIQRSLALRRHNGHAAHTYAHVCYETRDAAGGAAWLQDWLADFEAEAPLHGHNWWHLALFRLSQGDSPGAFAIYDRVLRPGAATSPALGLLADAASFLWRAQLAGATVDPRLWQAVSDYAGREFPTPGMCWSDFHHGLARAGTRDSAALERLAAAVRDVAAAGRMPAGDLTASILTGLHAFTRGDYSGSAALLAPLLPQLDRLGGSHAQRDAVELTLLESYLRLGQTAAAEALVRVRHRH